MKTTAYEATIENGQVKFAGAEPLSEHAKVDVVVPDAEEATRAHVGNAEIEWAPSGLFAIGDRW